MFPKASSTRNSTTIWGTMVQPHEAMGDILHSNHLHLIVWNLFTYICYIWKYWFCDHRLNQIGLHKQVKPIPEIQIFKEKIMLLGWLQQVDTLRITCATSVLYLFNALRDNKVELIYMRETILNWAYLIENKMPSPQKMVKHVVVFNENDPIGLSIWILGFKMVELFRKD